MVGKPGNEAMFVLEVLFGVTECDGGKVHCQKAKHFEIHEQYYSPYFIKMG